MNIIHLESGRNFGGQELRTIMEVKAMIQRGHHVEMVVKPNTPTWRRAVEEHIPVHCLPLKSAADLFSILWLVWKIQKDKVDILHSHSAKDAWIGGIAARLAPRRPAFIRTRHITNPIKHAYAYSKLPDALHVLTESRRQQFIRDHGVNPHKIFVFRPTVDLSRFEKLPEKNAVRKQFGIPATAWVWMNIAQFRGEKDHGTLVKAFAHAVKTIPDSVLVLVGEDKNHHIDTIKRLVDSLGIKDKVLFVGYQKHIEHVLPAADVFILSSIIEPFGKVIIEAFAAHVPVVATNVEGPSEIIYHGKNGLLAEVRNPQSIAEQALRFHREPMLARQCVEYANEWLEEVDFDGGIDKLLEHYEMMAKKTVRAK